MGMRGRFASVVTLVSALVLVGSIAQAGGFAWVRQFGTTGIDLGASVATDGTNVYVAGMTNGTFPAYVSAGGYDAFVRKYDAYGNLLWSRQFGTSGADVALSLAWVGGTNALYVAGQTEGALPGQTWLGSSDAFVRRYDPQGNVVWTRQFGTAGLDWAEVAPGYAGGVIVAGSVGGALVGDRHFGLADAYVRRLDAHGTTVWTRSFGTTSDDHAFTVATGAQKIAVGGETRGSLTGFQAGGADAFVRVYDPSGFFLWQQQFGTPSGDDVRGVAVGSQNDVFVVGGTGGALPNHTSAGRLDAYAVAYEPNGTGRWSRQFGTADNDQAWDVDLDASRFLLISGVTSGTLPGQTSAGLPDAFISKVAATSAQELYTRQFGTSGWDDGRSIAINGAQVVYVAGFTSGTFAGNTKAGGDFDAYVAKFLERTCGRGGVGFGTQGSTLLNPNGDETGSVSGPVHSVDNGLPSLAGSALHEANCGVIVRAGL